MAMVVVIESAMNPYGAAVKDRTARFEADLHWGRITPLFIAYDSVPLPFLTTTVFLLYYLGHRGSKFLRWSAFAAISFVCIQILRHVRVLGLAYGYGIGLIFSVGIMNSAALIIFNDPKVDFERLEQRQNATSITKANGKPVLTSGVEVLPNAGDAVQRKIPNGHSLESHTEDTSGQAEPNVEYFWQPYPSDFMHRLDWTIDLTTQFRGPGWNFRLRTFSPLSQDSSSDVPKPTSATRRQSFHLRKIFSIAVLYLTLDFLKVIMMYDPYFIGTAPLSSEPPSYLSNHFPILNTSPVLTKCYRLIISCTGVLVALNFVFLLCPPFYGVILPALLRRPHYTPLPEPFLYPPQQNSFIHVLDHGLAGWWGQWWHQMFRFGISEPSRVAVKSLGWNLRDQKARILQVMMAFTITGFLHAAGSYTCYEPTNPFSGPFLFFLLQGIGVLSQSFLAKNLGTRSLPTWLRRTGNMVVVVIWMYYTGPLFADDVAKSALWNFEPVPVSLLRGLGLGYPSEGWWCWHGPWVMYWEGRPDDPWWRKGWIVL